MLIKVKNAIPLPTNIVQYMTDDFLRLIGVEPPFIRIITLDPESLNTISHFNINAVLHNFYQPCIDNNCIYIPTKIGQLLVLDKFSGELISTINMKSNYIMSDILQTHDRLFCVAAIPINTKLKLRLDHYCICIFDKENCIKLVQTRYFTGPPAFLSINNDFLYAVGNEYLYKFSLDGEQEIKTRLHTPPDLPLLHAGSYILCCHRSGMVKVLNEHDLSRYAIVRGHPMESFPIITSDHEIMWFTKNGICRIDFHKQVSHHFPLNNTWGFSEILSTQDCLLGCDQNGRIISFRLNDHTIQMIKLANGKLRKPVMAGKYLFTLSDDKLHHLEIE